MMINPLNIVGFAAIFITFIYTYYLILKTKKDIENKTTTVNDSQYKTIMFLSKWYPAVFVVIVIAILYMM